MCNEWYTDENLEVTVDAGIQEWTVPQSGTYTIDIYGAKGGTGNNDYFIGGKGVRMKGRFDLAVDQILNIVVGQKGEND